MKEFIEVDGYGQLYIDKVLFESYFPIVFTCINDNGDIFICVCCQNNEKGCKWLVGKTSGENIVKMLRDEITIRQLLLDYSSGKISVDYIENEYLVAFGNSDWDENSMYLPKEDSYMYAEAGEFVEEIRYFSSMEHIYYDTEYYECLVEKEGKINKENEPFVGLLTAYISAIGDWDIQGEVIKTISTLVARGECDPDFMENIEKIHQGKYKSVLHGTFSALSEKLVIEMASEDSTYINAA